MTLKSKLRVVRVQIARWLVRPFATVVEKSSHVDNTDTRVRGRIIKVSAPAEYDPNKPQIKGGKIVRNMPKQLKKIKDAQDGQQG